ncbi:MAG TPA: carbon-nitrogen hydrolase family protein [Alphaproteobacteria bacterium]|nr:carbon-nitrogen hydrolase family protein [Alphaproteobacteria bacterium]HNS44566.1 carbon-nitrogen hydrolase family protein [Alphaproteobacteria bacterium]
MKIALVQMTSGPDFVANLSELARSVREAAAQGAVLIATPENTDLLGLPPKEKLEQSFFEDDHPMIGQCCALAKELNVWILLGSVAIKISAEKFNNRSYLFSPAGEVVALYDKIHLFDVDLPSGEFHRESDYVAAGNLAAVAETSFGPVGLSICYDLRFPHLYREMARRGAVILFVPAAFTVSTGEMHWEVLLRARAIENGAYVVAPAQCGNHGAGRVTYGHSMVVNPWGKVIAEAGTSPDVLCADLDLDEVARFRSAIPSLRHDRNFL